MNWKPDWSSVALAFTLAFALCTVTVGSAGVGAVGQDDIVTDGSTRAQTTATETTPTETTPTETTPTETTPTETTPTETTATETTATETTATPTASATPTPTPTATATATTTTTTGKAFVVTAVEAPDSLRVGETLDVTATVANEASTNATETLRYSFGGATVASQSVTLGPGESTTVRFTVPFSTLETTHGSIEPATYVHGVRNESGAGVARRLRVTPDVDFRVATFDAPVEVSHDESYIVLATVTNPGDTSITRQVAYEFAGRQVTEKAVTVAGNDDRQVAFEVALADVEAVVGPVENETTYDHGVVTGDDRSGGAVRVVYGPSANASALAVESFDVTDDVRPGDQYNVTLTVRNVATADFEGQVSYRVDGAIVATEWARVPIGEQRTVTFRVRYDDVVDAVGSLDAQETSHGVFVGSGAIVTRPVTVHAPLTTETATRPAPTFTASPGPEASGTPSTATTDAQCERGFFTACGGTAMDETSLTLVGVLLSAFGIVYQMLQGSS